MTYRTLAHGQIGGAELKLWVITGRRLDNPREFITRVWSGAVEDTSTFRDTLPDSFELNEPTDEEETPVTGQAIYHTDHGLYTYDFSSGRWVRAELRRDVVVSY